MIDIYHKNVFLYSLLSCIKTFNILWDSGVLFKLRQNDTDGKLHQCYVAYLNNIMQKLPSNIVFSL